MIRTVLVLGGLLALNACSAGWERATVAATCDGDYHLTVRAEGGHLWWSHRPWSEPHDICHLPGEGAVAHLAVRPVMTGSGEAFEITFDQDGSAWRGRILLDDASMQDTPVAFLRGTERVASDSSMELARAGR